MNEQEIANKPEERFTPLDMKLSNGEIVRVGGKEEDRKMVTK